MRRDRGRVPGRAGFGVPPTTDLPFKSTEEWRTRRGVPQTFLSVVPQAFQPARAPRCDTSVLASYPRSPETGDATWLSSVLRSHGQVKNLRHSRSEDLRYSRLGGLRYFSPCSPLLRGSINKGGCSAERRQPARPEGHAGRGRPGAVGGAPTAAPGAGAVPKTTVRLQLRWYAKPPRSPPNWRRRPRSAFERKNRSAS